MLREVCEGRGILPKCHNGVEFSLKGSVAMKGKHVFYCTVSILLCAGITQAGFLTLGVNVEERFPPVPDHVLQMWENKVNFDGLPPGLAAKVELGMKIGRQKDLPKIIITGETDADPVMHITQTLENKTGFTWTGYRLELTGTDVYFVVDSASSDVFTNTAYPDPLTLIFSQPDTVPRNGTVTFDYDILVESIGEFSFELAQTPIPEPATLMLLGLGSAVVFLKKK